MATAVAGKDSSSSSPCSEHPVADRLVRKFVVVEAQMGLGNLPKPPGWWPCYKPGSAG